MRTTCGGERRVLPVPGGAQGGASCPSPAVRKAARMARDFLGDTSESRRHQGASGTRFENKLCAFLRAQGVRFITEDDLRALHDATSTPPRSTPDVLFLDDVWVNGRLMRWMDAKSYFGTRYSNVFYGAKKAGFRWGPGCIVFAKGYSRRLHVPNTTLLGPASIDVVPPRRPTQPAVAHNSGRADVATAHSRARGCVHGARPGARTVRER